jgi:hypothetical protein
MPITDCSSQYLLHIFWGKVPYGITEGNGRQCDRVEMRSIFRGIRLSERPLEFRSGEAVPTMVGSPALHRLVGQAAFTLPRKEISHELLRPLQKPSNPVGDTSTST